MPVSTFENHRLEGKSTFGDPFLDSGVVSLDSKQKELTAKLHDDILKADIGRDQEGKTTDGIAFEVQHSSLLIIYYSRA